MFFEEEEDAKGQAPVFTGLHRPKLIWPGIDRRMLFVAFIWGVLGVASAYGQKSIGTLALFVFVFFGLAVLTVVFGLAMGKIAPYFFDEIAVYLTINFERFGFTASDDAGATFAGVKKWRS